MSLENTFNVVYIDISHFNVYMCWKYISEISLEFLTGNAKHYIFFFFSVIKLNRMRKEMGYVYFGLHCTIFMSTFQMQAIYRDRNRNLFSTFSYIYKLVWLKCCATINLFVFVFGVCMCEHYYIHQVVFLARSMCK